MTIDHKYTGNIVCPYCGDEDGDSWEYYLSDGDEKELKCCRCGRAYKAICCISITYSTEKIEGES